MSTFAERRTALHRVDIDPAKIRLGERVRFLNDHPEYHNTTGDLLTVVLSCPEYLAQHSVETATLVTAHDHKCKCSWCSRTYNNAVETKKQLMDV